MKLTLGRAIKIWLMRELKHRGSSVKEIAKAAGVSESTVRRMLRSIE